MSKRVLVTGGAGFISSNFIRHMLEDVQGGHILQRSIGQRHPVAGKAEDLIGPKALAQKLQRLLVIIQHHDAAKLLHLLREKPGARATIQKHIAFLRRPGPLDPFAHELPFA